MSETDDSISSAREGIKLLLNNKFEEAEELFSSDDGNIQMAAGYCFLTFMNALMTFEEDKLEESLQTLKDIEKKCYQKVGWLKSMKNKVLSTFNYSETDNAEKLEEQIILADSQVCVALLTFLHQDLTSYVKGGWVLRKAWKIYQHTYSQILNLYEKTFGCDNIPGSQFPSWQVVTKSASDSSLVTELSATSREWSVPSTPSGSNGFRSPLNYIASFAVPFNNNENTIEPNEVARLMGAVSFGYGIFQLCISLLPASLLRLIHFLGFEGDRQIGLSALMFSRKGTDMRAPLASLALLWYHTIVRPFFALDGSNVQAGVEEADMLINESQTEFGDSALFLFFKGRVQRLKSNIPEALKAYESAIEKSNQREISLLCLHEVGWCYLIQLDWGNAFHCFNQLRNKSKWSRSFYTYLTVGACGNTEYAFRLSEEIPGMINENNEGGQLETFILRRIKKFPVHQAKEDSTEAPDELQNLAVDKMSYELFILELLYFWNALPSCDITALQKIVENCHKFKREPMPGLCDLIEGAICLCVPNYEKAVSIFENCLEKRNNMKPNSESDSNDNNDHISAFAMFELATILVQKPETLERGKQLLLQAQNDYKGYDFENRLSIRIHSMLKKIN